MRISYIPPTIPIRQPSEASALADRLRRMPAGWETRLALDTETTGLSIVNDFPLYWSLSDGESRWCLDATLLLDGAFDDIFEDPDRVWVFANAKYDLHMLANYSVPLLRGRKYDIVGMSTSINENGMHGLKAQSKRELGIQMADFKSVIKVRRNADIPFLLMDPNNYEVVSDYASLDAYVTWLLSEKHYKEMQNIDYGGGLSAWDYFNVIEVPFTDCLWRIERRGMLVDRDAVERLRPEFEEMREYARAQVYRAAGKPLNINSGAQMSAIFFDEMKLKPLKYTSGGAPSLNKEVLKAYAKSGIKLAQHVLDFRQFDKYLGTYINGFFSDEMLAFDGRVHTTFNQFKTATGRLSSSDPNMQTLPSKDQEGSRLRSVFVPPDGYRLGVWDYSTLEMRVMANMSRDRVMVDAITKGLDLHCLTASQMMGVGYESAVAAKIADDIGLEDTLGVTKKLVSKTGISEDHAARIVSQLDEGVVTSLIRARTAAKTIGFGVLYGAGPKSISEQLGITSTDAKSKIEEWFGTFPGVRRYIENAHQAVLEPPHTVRTITGRYRHLPEAASPRHGSRSAAQRQAVNTPIQGSAGDLVKLAMLKIDQDLVLGGASLDGGELGVRMVLQVHDELIFEVPEECSADAEPLIVKHMQNPGVTLNVPLDVEGGYGANWKEAK